MNEAQSLNAKAQHYIPKFYLKGFTDRQGKLWVCEKFKPIRDSKPKCEAHHPDYYTHAEQGKRDETAEDSLEEIESRAAPGIRKLANALFRPTPEEMGHVYLFTAFMFARVPAWRGALDMLFARTAKEQQLKLANHKQRFYKVCAEMEQGTGKPLGMDVEELRQYVLKGQYDIVQASKAYNLGSMFDSAVNIANTMREFGYELLYAPAGRFFLTSDSPVFTVLPEGNRQATIGAGFGWPKVLVHFPLNKRVCLRLSRAVVEPDSFEISEYDLEQINRVTMMNASRYLYSSESLRRVSRLFDQWGCKIEPGKNAFMPTPQPAIRSRKSLLKILSQSQK